MRLDILRDIILPSAIGVIAAEGVVWLVEKYVFN